MIRGIYPKILLWFCFVATVTSGSVLLITVAMHSQSLGPRWMTGVLDQYARSAVDIYTHGGQERLQEYLEEIERSSRMQATLLDGEDQDIAGRGIPPDVEGVLAAARATGRTQFHASLRWTGASVVSGPEGRRFILVAEVIPFRGLWSWWGLRTSFLRLATALLCSALLCLALARHIAAPIRTLQAVAGRIADGDLSVRAFPAISVRNDELADLARDFDRMADCVQSLLKTQQELLGEVSHELRSPLARLSVSLELLRRGDADAIERMQVDLGRLDALIGQILTLTRLQIPLNRRTSTPVNLCPLLESVAEDASFEGARDGKSVVISHVDDCWLAGDPALLRSCFENVVRNAVRYTKPNTDVAVSLEFLDDDAALPARILVADHGDGVPLETLGRLFEPFYRISQSLDHRTGGTGLGLSIAQRVVVLHGGSIQARNQEVGGLELEIRLPASRAPVAVSSVT